MMRLAIVLALASAGCHAASLGFGVEVTVISDETVDQPALDTVRALRVQANTTDDDFIALTGLHRQETFVYRPALGATQLTLHISALDGNGAPIATGEASVDHLKSGHTSALTVKLRSTSAPLLDMAAVDLIATPPDLVVPDLLFAADASMLDLVASPPDLTTPPDLPAIGPAPSFLYAPVSAPVLVGQPADLVVGDFNNDGRDDVAVADGSASGGVRVLLGTSAGALGAVAAIGPAVALKHLAVGHFNNDANLDLVASSTGNQVIVYLGNGTGGFATGVTTTQSCVQLAVAKLDADALDDIACLDSSTTVNVTTRLSMGDGTFKPATTTSFQSSSFIVYAIVAGQLAQPVAPGDLGATPDLGGTRTPITVLAISGGTSLFVLPSNGAGGYGTTQTYTRGVSGTLRIADWDGDGANDVIIGSSTTGGFEVHRGASGQSATLLDPTYVSIPLTLPIATWVAEDVDKDGKADLVFHQGVGSPTLDRLEHLVAPFVVASFPCVPDVVAMATIDLDKDGTRDFLIANSDSLFIVRQNGSELPIYGERGGDATARAVVAANLIGGQVPDLVFADSSGIAGFLLSSGDGYAPDFTQAIAHGYPSDVCVADFDGDGQNDVAIVNRDTDDVSVIVNAGAGTWKPATSHGVGASPLALRCGDLDNDGSPDILTFNYGETMATASVLINMHDGSGAFMPATDLDVGAKPITALLRDLDKDGALDLVVLRQDGSMKIWKGNNDATFTSVATLAAGKSPSAIIADDIDGDGDLDLLVGSAGDRTLRVYRAPAALSYELWQVRELPAPPRKLLVGDWNGDTHRDVIVVTLVGPQMLYGYGTGYFGAATAIPLPDDAGSTVTADAVDFNFDGKLDLIAVDDASHAIFLQNGTY